LPYIAVLNSPTQSVVRVRCSDILAHHEGNDVGRHILSNVGRVAARDSSRTSATVEDLFVALCEDESIYGLFKSMKGA
jgi:hypothetical protein